VSVSDSLTRNVLSGLFPNDPRAVKAFEQLTFATDETAALASSTAQATGALQDATFLTLSPNDGAPNERVLKLGHGLTASDDGSFLTLSLGLGAALVEGGFSVTLRAQGVTDLILPFSGMLATEEYVTAAIAAIPGGGGAAWGAITGTLSAQTDLAAALAGKQAAGSYATASHTHTSADITDFTEASQDVVGAMVAAAGGTYDDGAGTITLPGAAVLKGTATVTPTANALEWTETVTATGVGASNVVMLSVAPHTDSDENDAEMLDIVAMSALPATNTITIDVSFLTPTQGPIKINWSAF